MFDLTGKLALVAGGAGVLGAPIAKALAQQGAQVIIADIAHQKAQQLAHEIQKSSPASLCKAAHLDIGSQQSIDDLLNQIKTEHQKLHIVINSTYWRDAKPFEQIDAETFDKVMHVNLTGCFLFARESAKIMPQGASMVLLSSMYGQVAPYPQVYQPPMEVNPIDYGMAKAAIIQMTRYLAVYWAKCGIRVNAVAPGPFPHESLRKANPEFCQRLAEKVPMARLGNFHEVAGAAVFLASDDASYITGQTLSVDGGWTAW